jgi:hypothetical protein
MTAINGALRPADLTRLHGWSAARLSAAAKRTEIGASIIVDGSLYKRQADEAGRPLWVPISHDAAQNGAIPGGSGPADGPTTTEPDDSPRADGHRPNGHDDGDRAAAAPRRGRRRQQAAEPSAAIATHTADHPVVVDELVDDDELAGIDIDGLAADVTEWLDAQTERPGPGAIDQILTHLAENEATQAVARLLIDGIADRWHAGRAKDRDRLVSSLSADWKRAQREFRDRLAIEEFQRRQTLRDPNDEPTPAERAEVRTRLWPIVRDLAMQPDLLQQAVEAVHAQGVHGEEQMIRLVYLAATSRVLHKPTSPLIVGPSAGGKSHTSGAALNLIPPEEIVALSSASALSLVYDGVTLVHRILTVFEATPLQNDDNGMFAMLVRVLMSEGKLIHKTTVEDQDSPTGRRVETIEKRGPIALLVTSTGQLHAENETRMLRYGVTESQEQTKAVMAQIAKQATQAAPEHDHTLWHDLQRWIGAGPRDVLVPFAPQLADRIPPAAVRLRRDFSSLLGLIRASALLHQAQRETKDGAIVAAIDDYRHVRDIALRSIEETVGARPTDRVTAIVQYVASKLALEASAAEASAVGSAAAAPEKGIQGRRSTRRQATIPSVSRGELTISVRSLGQAMGIDRKAAENGLYAALDAGFLDNRETLRGKPMRLVMGSTALDGVIAGHMLPMPDDLS